MFPPCSRRGVMVITTVQLHSTKPKLRFCAGSNPVWHVGDSRWWGSLRMVPAGNKVKCLLSVNHTTKTIHHHHHSSTLKSLKSTKYIFQNNIIATFIYLEVIRVNYIVGTPPPLPSENWVTWWGTKCFVRKGYKFEKEGCHFFITL